MRASLKATRLRRWTFHNDLGGASTGRAGRLTWYMKQVVAIVKPFLAERILEGLRRAPLEAVHIREVKGMGRQKSYLDQYSESEFSSAFLPKVELNLFVEDEHAEPAVQKILQVARSGRMGDGKVFSILTVPEMKMIEF